MSNIISILIKFLGGTLIIFGLSSNAAFAASGCDSLVGTFSASVGSTASCGDYKGTNGLPMNGCLVSAEGDKCTYNPTPTCSFELTATTMAGDNNADSTKFDVTAFGCQPKVAITKGNQGDSYCSYFYPLGTTSDTLTTKTKQGKFVAHKSLEVCTDDITVVVPPPVISLEKKVVRADIEDTINGGFLDPNCFGTVPINPADPTGPTKVAFSDEAADEINVIAPGEFVYCYLITNSGQGHANFWSLNDPLITFDVNQDSFNSSGVPFGPLLSDSVKEVQSPIVLLATRSATQEPGDDACVSHPDPCLDVSDVSEVLNTATASTTFDGDCLDNCIDTDTAKINILVTCDATTQDQATDSRNIIESTGIHGTKRCVPEPGLVDGILIKQSVGLLCDDSCETKPACLINPTGVGCDQLCKPSGNWSEVDTTDNSCIPGTPSPDKLPQCREVLRDPGNNCEYENPTPGVANGNSIGFRRNPYLYYYPSSGGGNSIGTIYCILYDGEGTDVCPSGSIVY